MIASQQVLYYIQNRGYCGDCLLWWKSNRCGYTLNLDEALKLPEDEALMLIASRPLEDFAYRVDLIDSVAHRHVNSETLRAAGNAIERLRK